MSRHWVGFHLLCHYPFFYPQILCYTDSNSNVCVSVFVLKFLGFSMLWKRMPVLKRMQKKVNVLHA